MEQLKWLKEDQRRFLEKDYLIDNQTPEKRLEEMSKTIEK